MTSHENVGLDKCPFCGVALAEMNPNLKAGMPSGGIFVHPDTILCHTGDGCILDGHEVWTDRPQDVDDWNRRPLEDALQADREMLLERVEGLEKWGRKWLLTVMGEPLSQQEYGEFREIMDNDTAIATKGASDE